MEPPDAGSYMFHYPTVKWTHLQGEALGLPTRFFSASEGKRPELASLKQSLSTLKERDHINGLVTGAIESGYQKRKIDMICEEVGVASLSPLWRKDPALLLRETLHLGFETYIVGVSASGLDQTWLGRRLDKQAMEELQDLHSKWRIHIGGEGGEYETFVADADMFRKRIRLVRTSKCWNGSSGYLIIHEAELTSKP
jgi:ABC transporter with metal-binding/Fe-S-binding domain ATP-binding protein